jgi:AcrR family transcriptional regulator
MTTPVAPARSPGRPRDARADDAIIDATLALLVEEGFDRLSMDAVAARAGVGKATIYRRWPSKEALVIDAVARRTEPVPVDAAGPVRDQLVALLEGLAAMAASSIGKLLPCMVGASVSNPALAAHYRAQILLPRRARVREVVERGVAAGELRADLDVEVAIDTIVGPLLYRVVFARDRVVEPDECAAFVDAALRGLAP